ncbi:MAG: DUF1549 domain-containing protein, partial [Planctomycetaceae bacterium]
MTWFVRQRKVRPGMTPLSLVAGMLLAWGTSGALAEEPAISPEPTHWAFRPVSRPAVPAVRQGELVRSPVDAFLLSRLQEQQLQFAPEATRREQIRRLKFDLTGLPPTPAEITEYLQDPVPDAYERLVERLLASPQY